MQSTRSMQDENEPWRMEGELPSEDKRKVIRSLL